MDVPGLSALQMPIGHIAPLLAVHSTTLGVGWGSPYIATVHSIPRLNKVKFKFSVDIMEYLEMHSNSNPECIDPDKIVAQHSQSYKTT